MSDQLGWQHDMRIQLSLRKFSRSSMSIDGQVSRIARREPLANLGGDQTSHPSRATDQQSIAVVSLVRVDLAPACAHVAGMLSLVQWLVHRANTSQ